jgi:hypothetical protein
VQCGKRNSCFLQVLESQRPNVSSPADTISAAIRAAAQAVGAEPVTSLARVDADVRSDLPLVESYGEEIRRQTAERVRSDADYVSVKYPNAEKYLGSGGQRRLKMTALACSRLALLYSLIGFLWCFLLGLNQSFFSRV